jgi:hypothetical protein
MAHQFSRIPKANIPRSSFDRSHGLKTVFDAGYLIPIYVDEALPGDTFNCKMTAFARLATPIKPIMDNMFMETFFFAVPNRLIWDNWQKFNGEQDNPGDSIDFVVPKVPNNPANFGEGGLGDYFGLPTQVPIQASALWFRAYNLIYNEWFRDQNLQDSVPVATGDANDPVGNYTLLRRGKRHDYFTSCLPWPQKGDAVDLPLGTTAPVIPTGPGVPIFDADDFTGALQAISVGPNVSILSSPTNDAAMAWNDPALVADLSGATAATINQLRQAFQIQKLQERDARGGTRYTEIIRSHFGVTSPDARLQRPEFLGGGSSMVNINPVEQNTQTLTAGNDTPQGNLAAYGTASLQNHGFTKSFTEHCVLIGLVNVRADLTYQQGLNRMWSRETRYDFYWPVLSHIGEQAVLNKEIFMDGSPTDDQVFGYQERYAEYRYKPSQVTGAFRSNAAAPLDVWHLAQEFGALPTLSAAFIEDDPPIDRVIAVQNEPHFLFDAYFQLRCARPMPLYGVPGLIDHF